MIGRLQPIVRTGIAQLGKVLHHNVNVWPKLSSVQAQSVCIKQSFRCMCGTSKLEKTNTRNGLDNEEKTARQRNGNNLLENLSYNFDKLKEYSKKDREKLKTIVAEHDLLFMMKKEAPEFLSRSMVEKLMAAETINDRRELYKVFKKEEKIIRHLIRQARTSRDDFRRTRCIEMLDDKPDQEWVDLIAAGSFRGQDQFKWKRLLVRNIKRSVIRKVYPYEDENIKTLTEDQQKRLEAIKKEHDTLLTTGRAVPAADYITDNMWLQLMECKSVHSRLQLYTKFKKISKRLKAIKNKHNPYDYVTDRLRELNDEELQEIEEAVAGCDDYAEKIRNLPPDQKARLELLQLNHLSFYRMYKWVPRRITDKQWLQMLTCKDEVAVRRMYKHFIVGNRKKWEDEKLRLKNTMKHDIYTDEEDNGDDEKEESTQHDKT